LPGQLETIPGVGDLIAHDAEHRQIGIDEVADIEIVAVSAEGGAFG